MSKPTYGYPYTLRMIRFNLAPHLRRESGEDTEARHLLFMCDEIERMDDSLKAARWIGYAIRMCEGLCTIDNRQTRVWVRQDVQRHG